MAGGYLPFGFAPSGELTSYTPTLRERATDWLRTKLFSDDRAGQDKANRVMDVVGVTPFGFALDTYDAGREAGMGNYGTAGVMLGMAGLPGPSPKKGIRAFHGSPHDFDRFSLDKIGTGEGAQAYGHGLYFAENEDIARGYRDALKPGKGMGPEDTASRVLDMHGGDRDAAMASLRESIDRANAQNMPYEEVQRLMMAKNILNTQPQRASGRMYEVEIDADPEAFLDWDKPLSEQLEVQAKLATIGEAARSATTKGMDKYISLENVIGREVRDAWVKKRDELAQTVGYNHPEYLAHLNANPNERAAVSAKLREAGIPGIKYLDAGSRGAGDGTRNYVVFDDNLINIIRKYGIAGASAMLGYNILDGMDEAQAAELKSIEGK